MRRRAAHVACSPIDRIARTVRILGSHDPLIDEAADEGCGAGISAHSQARMSAAWARFSPSDEEKGSSAACICWTRRTAAITFPI
ncbi:MAG: hypothetical protein R2881_00595 [Eubacteriales bacterium]